MENKNIQKIATNFKALRQHCEIQLQEAKVCNDVNDAVVITFKNNLTRVGELMREGQKELITMFITAEVAQYCAMLPASRSVSPEVVMLIGKTFSEHPDVRHLSLTELKTFLSLAFKRQEYGKLYGGFGYDTLLEWFNLFYIQRTESVMNYREQEHTIRTQREKIARYRQDGDAFGATPVEQLKNIIQTRNTND